MSTEKNVTNLQTTIESLRTEYERQKTLTLTDSGAKQGRGCTFEQLVREVFRAHGLLIRDDYHTKQNRDEQVDGAIELPGGRIALIEAKWVESRELAASDLFAFLGKVENHCAGTFGIFISQVELKENFVRALRYGRRQCVAVIHGSDVDALFDPAFKLADYLLDLLRHLSTDNVVHIPVAQWDPNFFCGPSSAPQRPTADEGQVSPLRDLLLECVEDPDVKNIPDEQAQKIAAVDASGGLVELFEMAKRLNVGFREQWKREGLLAVGAELIPLLGNEETEADRCFFDFVTRDYRDGRLPELLDPFLRCRWKHLDRSSVERFERRLLDQWKRNFGDYHAENNLSARTGAFWSYLSADVQNELKKEYFGPILASDRGRGFPQWRLAKNILGDQQDLEKYVWPLVVGRVAERARTMRNLNYDIDTAEDYLLAEMEHVKGVFSNYAERHREIVASVFQANDKDEK